MVRRITFIALLSCFGLFSQESVLNGEVSFVTSNNIYVRFDDTSLIKIGDSLRIDGHKGEPCLLVNSKSTTSCVCRFLDDCEITKGEKVIFIVPKRVNVSLVSEEKPKSTAEPVELEQADLLYPQEITARISASTYSLVANNREDRHRLMSRLSIDANHINDSKFSADVYMNFRQILNQGSTSSIQNNTRLRVFNFGVNYEASPTLNVTLGRNINPKIASLGAIDGLQAEKQFGHSYVGAIIGIEQRGNGEIDRRYTYLQHSSTLFKKLNLFASAEMDIYSKMDLVAKNELRLTNLYTSVRYRFSRAVNAMVSYDARKRIIYYETYRSDLEQLLDDDLARQGFRTRVNFRPIKNVYTGFSYSKRFQSDQQNQSDNIYGYFTLSKTPYIEGRSSLSYNRNQSNYLLSNIASFRHSRTFMRNRLNTDLYYRFVHYDYANINDSLLQHFVGADVSYNITRTLLFSVTGEYSMYNDSKNYRIYTRIIQRFHNKHRN